MTIETQFNTLWSLVQNSPWPHPYDCFKIGRHINRSTLKSNIQTNVEFKFGTKFSAHDHILIQTFDEKFKTAFKNLETELKTIPVLNSPFANTKLTFYPNNTVSWEICEIILGQPKNHVSHTFTPKTIQTAIKRLESLTLPAADIVWILSANKKARPVGQTGAHALMFYYILNNMPNQVDTTKLPKPLPEIAQLDPRPLVRKTFFELDT